MKLVWALPLSLLLSLLGGGAVFMFLSLARSPSSPAVGLTSTIRVSDGHWGLASTAPATAANCPDPEGANLAVLHQVHPLLSSSGGSDTEYALTCKLDKIRELREWAATADPCLRSSYIEWLDFYERETNRHLDGLRNPAAKKEPSWEIQNRKIRAYVANHPLPNLPKGLACDREKP